MGADYSFYVKTIEIHARAFFKVNIFFISSVIIKYTSVFCLNFVFSKQKGF